MSTIILYGKVEVQVVEDLEVIKRIYDRFSWEPDNLELTGIIEIERDLEEFENVIHFIFGKKTKIVEKTIVIPVKKILYIIN